jgi:hypothetical protein
MTPLLPVLFGGNKWKKYKMKIMREEKMLGEKKKGTHGHFFYFDLERRDNVFRTNM